MSDWQDLVILHGNIEGARAAFENACESIIRAKYPNKKVRGVRTHVGDSGIDIYVGDLGVAPVDVYQCKYFINGIGDSQKTQIRDSFRTATRSTDFTVNSWYLCIPVKLSVQEASWFDGWTEKQTASAKLIPPGDLLLWSEQLGLANTIFKRDDSLKLDAILADLRKINQDPWNALVDQTEKDCYKILLKLLREHLRCLAGKYPSLEALSRRAEAGDRIETCQYFKSVLVGNLDESEKTWIFTMLNDFTLEPIAYKFIRRYEELVKKAEELGRQDSLSTSEFYSLWGMFRSPIIKGLRDKAYWTVDFPNR